MPHLTQSRIGLLKCQKLRLVASKTVQIGEMAGGVQELLSVVLAVDILKLLS